MKKVFLDYLPKLGTKTDWKNSIGYSVQFIYDSFKGEIKIIEYNNKILTLNYNGNEFMMSSGGFISCKLGRIMSKVYPDSGFRYKIGETLIDDKRNLTITEREHQQDKTQNWKWYKYTCNKCGWTEGWVRENNLVSGKGCSCCCPTPRVVVEGINDIPTTAPWMVKYFQGGYDEAKLYVKNSGKRIYPICPECGQIKHNGSTIDHINCSGYVTCSCSDGQSYSTKLMAAILNQLDVEYKTEYSPKWIHLKRYDFYIPSKNIIIEMDGGFHFKDNSRSGVTYEESKQVDDYKDLKASENGIEVIRIDCIKGNLDFIKQNILDSSLSTIFNLLNIDWIKCEEFTLRNLMKAVCKYKKDNPTLSAPKIGKIMNLSVGTIIRYLKQGTELGLCYYNPIEEKSMSSSNNGSIGHQIEIFKNEKSLGVFKSITELRRQSENLFKVKLSHPGIIGVCDGTKDIYKGFIFKYI